MWAGVQLVAFCVFIPPGLATILQACVGVVRSGCARACRIFAAPMKEQHLAIRSCKDTQHDRSVALTHKTQAEAAVKAAKAKLAQLRSSGKPEAVLQVR